MKKIIRKVEFCAEINSILESEISTGNLLLEAPAVTDWPASGSVFSALKNDLNIRNDTMPKGVKHRICTDLHFGWHDECLCEIHKHLLVAGVTRTPVQKNGKKSGVIVADS